MLTIPCFAFFDLMWSRYLRVCISVVSFFMFLCLLIYVSDLRDEIERLEAARTELQTQIDEEVCS